MNKHDIKTAFGETPASFRHQVDQTLMQLEDAPMKKRYKFTTMLAVAVLCVMMLAGAAFAAAQFGLLEHFSNYADPITPLQGAENLIVTDLGATENSYIRVEVEEAMFDGRNAQLQLRISPKDPANYALLPDILPDTPEDEYIIERTEYEDGSYTEEVVGRHDGRGILRFTCSPKFSGADSFDGNSLDHINNEDGSVTMWSSVNFSNSTIGELNVSLETHLWVKDEKVSVEPIAFTLPKNEVEQTYALQPVEGSGIDGFEFLPGEVTFTKLRSYITVNYAHDLLKDDSMGYTFALLDADGNELPGDGGWTDRSAEGDKQINADVIHAQALDPIPETITLKCWEIGHKDNPIGTITFTVTPIE